MAPSKAPFVKDERVLCFHHEMLYEAKILDVRMTDEKDIHSWHWDDWVPQDRVRKFTEENKELAAQLHNQMKALQNPSRGAPKSTTKGRGGRANGSDFSSARGSEERYASVAAQSGRGGPRRNRDYDLEPYLESLLERKDSNCCIHSPSKHLGPYRQCTPPWPVVGTSGTGANEQNIRLHPR
ncbi:related to Chromo domain protein Alp13 [Rhynchosporium graminicola]|uniref:Chromatin modification-related protein EAF3 n=1 Tax=Rhynchosporium graminicola TaxID=2792576 RepID=A0A1E1JUS1_9HELO|nr:related to Chromo domain protein Alp13 [Rhynchosporium commune]